MTTSNTTKPISPRPMDYGFSSNFTDLSAVTPRVKPKPNKKTQIRAGQGGNKKPKPKTSDITAKAHGFSSREATPMLLKKRRRTHHDEPVDQLSIRGPVRTLNNFITYCEAQSLSYWEGLDALLQPHTPTKK